MSASVAVRRVESPADKDAFLRLPWKIYADDPNWVPPLVSMRREKLEPEDNPMYEHLEIEYFVAWRGAEAVGCIAAFINYHHNEFHNEHIGWFGLFDVMDDAEAGAALLQTAEAWVREKGYDGIRGPASFGDLDEFGLLVDYFDQPHVLLMAYNPAYYMTFVEDAGFEGIMDMLSYKLAVAAMQGDSVPPKIIRVLEKMKKRRKITLRNPDMKNFAKELDTLIELYVGAWNDNWGFVPPTRAEVDTVVGQYERFIDPEYIIIVEVNDEPAGFLVLLPDLNQVLAHARPHPDTPEWITLLKALWHLKVRPKVTRTRVPLLGVLPQYQGMGLDAMLYMASVEPAAKGGFIEGDFGWILADNLAMNQISDLVNAPIYKRYRMYHKDFGGAETVAESGEQPAAE